MEADLRALLGVPDDYAVLFMQGGASLQFALTVMNLAGEGDVAFADTGYWSKKAIATARRLVPLHVVCETVRDGSADDERGDEERGAGDGSAAGTGKAKRG